MRGMTDSSAMRRARRVLLATGAGLALATSTPGLASAAPRAKPAAPSAEARHTTTPAPPAKVIAKANLFGHKVG